MCAAWCGWGSQAERAWGNAQPEDALWKAARAGDLAACTRLLLGAGTHPVGYKGDWASGCRLPSRFGNRFNQTGGESWFSMLRVSARVGRATTT